MEKVRRIKRPRGVFPSLPGGMDGVIKLHYDRYRAAGRLPPELEGKVEGLLVSDQALMNVWRNWRQGISIEDPGLDCKLSGAMDDCLLDDGCYVPLDYKTRGYPPKEEGSGIYQHQLDCYTLLLKENGYPVKNIAWLIYYYPASVGDKGLVTFTIEPTCLETSPDAARALLTDAVKCLKGPEPPIKENCEFCAYRG